MDLPDLSFLRTFVAVYEAGSITAAAAALYRTQPTVSWQLRRIEEALGTQLFARSKGRLLRTAAAERLHLAAGVLARNLHALREGDPAEMRPLNVASVSAFGRYVLFPLLVGSEWLRRGLRVRFPIADEVFRLAIEGEIDVGFSYRPATHARLFVEPIYKESLVLIAGREWTRRLRQPGEFREVAMVTWDECEYVIGRFIGRHFRGKSPRWFSAAHAEELEEVARLVGAGLGVSVVPSFLPRPRGVEVISWGRAPVENWIHAVRPRHVPLRPAVSEILRALKSG